MRTFFQLAGCLCLMYYGLIVWYSRRLNSTFAVFWLISGGVHLILGCAPFPVFIARITDAAYICCGALFLFTEMQILAAMSDRKEKKCDWVIVLGAQVRGTKITDSLRRRLDAAVCCKQKYPDTRIIVSGGQGPGEDITEAAAMADYLIRAGVDRASVYLEDRSKSTRENLRFSRELITEPSGTVGIITNNFHIYRACLIAEQEGYRNPRRIPASSNSVYQVNYLVREFFAVIYVRIQGMKHEYRSGKRA